MYIKCTLALLLIITMSSCAHYRSVRVYEVVDELGDDQEVYYAIAKNNVIIPEYVVDYRGNYPSSEEAAWERFESRKDVIESSIQGRYRVPNSFLYNSERYVFMVGLIIVSPVVIPITYISELIRTEEDELYEGSFSKVVSSYFDLSMNEPIKIEPDLQDAFEIANICN